MLRSIEVPAAALGAALVVAAATYCIADSIRVNGILGRARQASEGSSVCKEGFSAKKIAALGEPDVVVIGSGISALAAANLLARRGKTVIVLEQHDIAGGNLHSFSSNGFDFDTGVHYIGGDVQNPLAIFGFLFDTLSRGLLRWTKMDATYDEALLHAPCGQGLASFEFGNLQVTRDNLVSRFPDDEARIDRYLRLVKGSETAFPMYVLSRCLPRFLRCLLLAPSVYFDKTTREVIDGIFRDSRDLETIRGVLSYLYGDYGLPPGESAFVMTALVMNHYLHGGAFYPSAGPQSIAEALVPTVLAAGGAVWVRARVDRILVERGSVVGVAVRGCEIRCRTVISAVGAENTYFSLLRQHDGCAAVARGRFDIGGGGISRSCAMFTVFVGLDSPASQLGLPAKNSWVFPSWDHDQNMRRYHESVRAARVGAAAIADMFIPLVFVASSSSKGDARATAPASIELLTVCDFEAFNMLAKGKALPKHRGGEYEKQKELLSKRLLETLFHVHPHLRMHVTHVETGSPLSNQFYLGSRFGEVYGLAHDVSRFSAENDVLTTQTPAIRGLFLAGQDSVTVGVCGALMSGVIAACRADPTCAVDLAASYIKQLWRQGLGRGGTSDRSIDRSIDRLID